MFTRRTEINPMSRQENSPAEVYPVTRRHDAVERHASFVGTAVREETWLSEALQFAFGGVAVAAIETVSAAPSQ
jgi:hypothetical protein